MPIITRIYRTGSQRHYTIALDCGHKYVVENAMVKRDQLYVGKGGQECVECDPAHAPPAPEPIAYREPCACPECGWTFTVDVLAGLDPALYARPGLWFCPHCGKTAKGIA